MNCGENDRAPCDGIEPFPNGTEVGVGRGDGLMHCWVYTPPRKIRVQFHEYKHTSLALSVEVFCETRHYGVQGSLDERICSGCTVRQLPGA